MTEEQQAGSGGAATAEEDEEADTDGDSGGRVLRVNDDALHMLTLKAVQELAARQVDDAAGLAQPARVHRLGRAPRAHSLRLLLFGHYEDTHNPSNPLFHYMLINQHCWYMCLLLD